MAYTTFHLLKLMQRIANKIAPIQLQTQFTCRTSQRTNSLLYKGPQLLNTLPNNLKNNTCLPSFPKKIQKASH